MGNPVDERGDLGVAFGVERVDGAQVADRPHLRGGSLAAAQRDAAELDDEARDLDAEGREQLPGQAAGRHAGSRLAGAGPFEHGPHAAEMLDGAGEIGMAGAGPLDVFELLELGVAVDHLHRQRAAERDAPPETGEKRDGVGFDPLPAAATMAALAADELGVDRSDVDLQAGGKPVDQCDKRGAVRFSGGPVTKHGGVAGEAGDEAVPRF